MPERSIFNWFSRKRPADVPREPAAHGAKLPIDPEIQLVLRRVFNDHALLTIHIAGHPDAYTSAILELVPEQGYLVLDELTPASGHALVLSGTQFHVRGTVEGIALRYTTTVSQIGEHNALPYYQVDFPATIDYPQRRRQYRVTVPSNRGFDVEFRMADGRQLSGELGDMSVGGFCARIRTGVFESLRDAHQRATCRLLVPNAQPIIAEVEILHLDALPRPRVQRARVRFTSNISPTTARRVAQFCAELERAQRQLC
ncbi:MAG: hypothetical protein EXR83_03785 [Gammaproteobacteria bacterium]|nr:hypothetical protein [Gammaproteobacteria bacterium]